MLPRQSSTECLGGLGGLGQGEVARFYRGRSVLLTGASGFMGKVLVEKLLRECPDLDRVFVLLRPKRGHVVGERLQQLLDTPVFDTLRATRPHTLDKVVAVAGDVTSPALGLSPDDRSRLIKSVSVVFHVAAVVRFMEPLQVAYDINIKGTRAVLDLCRQLKGLVALVHTSTAYSNCNRQHIDEVLYEAAVTVKEVERELATKTAEEIESSLPGLLDRTKYPNTYALTKALAETVVVEEGAGLPTVIFRPSIVVPTWRDPMPGWVDNLNGPVGTFLAIGKGTMSCIYANRDMIMDIIPVDTCINMMVVSAWDRHERRHEETGALVLNCVSGPSNPLTWGRCGELWMDCLREQPYEQTVWKPSLSYTTSRLYYTICTFLGQLLPAYALDLYTRFMGQPPIRLGARIKNQVHRFQSFEFFTTHEWSFSDNNVRALWGRMKAEDQEDFPFSIDDLDWEEYMENVLMGTKTYLLERELRRRQSVSIAKRLSVSQDRRISVSVARRLSVSQRRRSSVNPDRRDSVNQERKNSVNPDSRRNSVNPDSRRNSVNPDSKRNSVNPDSRRNSVESERRNSINQERRGSVNQETRNSITSEGKMKTLVRELSRNKISPEMRKSISEEP